jgi:hypothetical protein
METQSGMRVRDQAKNNKGSIVVGLALDFREYSKVFLELPLPPGST